MYSKYPYITSKELGEDEKIVLAKIVDCPILHFIYKQCYMGLNSLPGQ